MPDPFTRSEAPTDLLAQGLVFQQSGQAEHARACYERVLVAVPEHPDAWHLLGLIDLDRGLSLEALGKFERALATFPDHAPFHFSRIKAEIALERIGEATAHAKESATLWPENPEAWTLLGDSLSFDHQADPRSAYEKALALNPGLPAASFGLAQWLSASGQFEEAASILQQAVAVHPRDPQLLNNLGLALEKLGRPEEAEQRFHDALAIDPKFAQARANLGRKLLGDGAAANALRYLEPPVIELRESFEYWLALALARQGVGRTAEAIPAFVEAVRLRPDDARLTFNLGAAYFELPDIPRAYQTLKRAIELEPGFAPAEMMLIEIVRRLCRWEEYRRLVAKLPSWIARCDELLPAPHALVSLPVSPGDQLRVARAYAGAIAAPAGEPRKSIGAMSAVRSNRLRLGYVSVALREHPTTALVTEILERHDPQRIELFVFALGSSDDSPCRKRIAGSVEHFFDLELSTDSEIVALIRKLGIQVLIDLDGFTQHSHPAIFAARSAPLQINYLGFPGTLGSDFHDHILCDATVAPQEHSHFFSEKLLQLPHCYLPSDTTRRTSAAASNRADWGLPEEAFVFCSFNHLYKLLPEMFDVWMRILHRTPSAVLWLMVHEQEARQRLLPEAEARGIAPSRLYFASPVAMPLHLARYRVADLFLDNLPCNAHTTCNDALLMGLPVLTCMGETFAGRVAASHLRAVDLPELVTANLKDYEELAVSLAQQPEPLASFRKKLEETGPTSPLFDMEAYTRVLEERLIGVWNDYLAKTE